MDIVEQLQARLRNAADGLLRELTVSHGVEHVKFVVKDRKNGIEVTVKEGETNLTTSSTRYVDVDPDNVVDGLGDAEGAGA